MEVFNWPENLSDTDRTFVLRNHRMHCRFVLEGKHQIEHELFLSRFVCLNQVGATSQTHPNNPFNTSVQLVLTLLTLNTLPCLFAY